MKKIKMIISMVMVSVMVMAVAGCGSTKLADAFDEETVKSSAQAIIDLLNAGDYDGVVNTFSEETKAAITAERLEEVCNSVLAEAGAFTEYKSVVTVGQKNKSTGEDTAVVVIVAAYENQNVTYTISIDLNMEVTGFYLK